MISISLLLLEYTFMITLLFVHVYKLVFDSLFNNHILKYWMLPLKAGSQFDNFLVYQQCCILCKYRIQLYKIGLIKSLKCFICIQNQIIFLLSVRSIWFIKYSFIQQIKLSIYKVNETQWFEENKIYLTK